MMRILAISLIVASCSAAEIPDGCFLTGQGYNQTSGHAIQVHADTPALCQEECKRTEICAFFTWFNNTKGCWLQSSAATLSIVSDQVTSGPVRCIEKTGAGKGVVGALNESTGAAFPWWAWLFIGLLLAVGGLLCLACLCCTQNKKSKRARRLDEKSRDVEVANTTEEARVPLTATPNSSSRQVLVSSSIPVVGRTVSVTQAPPVAAPSVAVGPPVYLPATAATSGKDLFDMLDKDGDGQLSKEELMAARQMRVQSGAYYAPVPAPYVQTVQMQAAASGVPMEPMQ